MRGDVDVGDYGKRRGGNAEEWCGVEVALGDS